jgi:hypothetical protein
MKKRTHPVLRWLLMEGMTQARFAALSGVSEGFISRMVNWQAVPGRESAKRMRRASKNALTFDDIFAERAGG